MTTVLASTRPPVATGSGALGVSRDFQRRPLELMRNLFDEHGDLVKVRFVANQYFYLVTHPDYIRHIFATNSANYTKSPHPAFELLSQVMGRGLVTSDGDLWSRQRRLIQPAFTKQRVDEYGDLMVSATERMATRWRQAGDTTLNLDAEMMRLTLDVVGQTLFGLDLTDEASRVSRAFTEVSDDFAKLLGNPLGPLALKIPFQPTVRRFRRSTATLDTVVHGIIAQRREQPEPDNRDLLTLLMAARDEQTGEGMTDQQLRDEVMTLLLSGHETTADALTWAFYLLARHPKMLADLEDEVDEVLGGRAATTADLPRLVYTKMVVQETLRLYPPIYLFARWGHQPDEVGGYDLPADATITVCPYVVHRHPEFWPDAEAFRPDRFDSAAKAIDNYAYIPFSGGPRQCLGIHFAMMEAQLLLATVVQNFRCSIAGSAPINPGAMMTLRPAGGMPVRVSTRPRGAHV
ncbi:cytochrome P450 [Frankia sp. Ag45/Mut15]|uniref:Cytochrome P450 n=1 Tax=Frankia umida TaxID=573489 RepID=A0ABT0JUF0_9ACTN|nr:cytochrome P450 [Frankia umida]MCK9874638.1 cytochrome P450 [Frankia umida]